MWFVIRASHLPSGLKSEDVMHGARRQKSQVDSKTCGGEATPDSLLSQIATASLFLGGKRRTGDGRSGSSILGTAKRFLAVKKKNRFYHENSDGSEQGQLEGKYDGSCTERVVIIPYCYRETKLHDRNCSSQLAYPKDIHGIICSLRDTYQWYKLITTGEHVIIASYIFGELNQKFRFC